VPVPTGPAREVAHGPRTRPEVALTFHGAGDPALATEILGALAQGKARATVLAVGTWLSAHRDLARRITGEGHELGNHTWTHPVLADLGRPAARVEIERCRDLLLDLTGTVGGHFRQSGGAHSTPLVRTLAGAAGYPLCLSYDVDSLDYTDPGPAAVRRNVAAAVRPGSVVSLHLGHPGTLAALPAVLADLAARGLRPVTATTLLRP
jgi:peptidoglycan/xylan/chitin deacetylase (PgdA/CDA1 family)